MAQHKFEGTFFKAQHQGYIDVHILVQIMHACLVATCSCLMRPCFYLAHMSGTYALCFQVHPTVYANIEKYKHMDIHGKKKGPGDQVFGKSACFCSAAEREALA